MIQDHEMTDPLIPPSLPWTTSPATGSSVSTSVLRAQMQFIIVRLSRRSLQTNKEKVVEKREMELLSLCSRVLSSGTPLISQISGYEM